MMLTSLFFNFGGTSKESGSAALSFDEGLRLELPCVQSAFFFAQEKKPGGESDSTDEKDAFLPVNWGMRIFKACSDSPGDVIGVDFAMGRIGVGGLFSDLKNPVPSLKKKWTACTPGSMRLKASLPSAGDSKKPVSVFFSLGSSLLSAGFAVVAVHEDDDAIESAFGAKSLVFHSGFFPLERNGFSFSTASTLSFSEFEGTKSGGWFSLKTFHPQASGLAFMNKSLLIKKMSESVFSVQNDFTAALADFKNGVFCCDNVLLCLSMKKVSLSVGLFLSDFGFVTCSGTEILDVLKLYGSFSSSFKLKEVAVKTDFSCMTALGYDDEFPVVPKPLADSLSTDIMGGVSVSYGEVSVTSDCALKKLCCGDGFCGAVCEFSLGIGASGGAVVWEGERPLFFADDAFEWGVKVSFEGDKTSLFSGGMSVKFKDTDFSQAKCSLAFSRGGMRLSGSVSISAAKKVTWSVSSSLSF